LLLSHRTDALVHLTEEYLIQNNTHVKAQLETSYQSQQDSDAYRAHSNPTTGFYNKPVEHNPFASRVERKEDRFSFSRAQLSGQSVVPRAPVTYSKGPFVLYPEWDPSYAKPSDSNKDVLSYVSEMNAYCRQLPLETRDLVKSMQAAMLSNKNPKTVGLTLLMNEDIESLFPEAIRFSGETKKMAYTLNTFLVRANRFVRFLDKRGEQLSKLFPVSTLVKSVKDFFNSDSIASNAAELMVSDTIADSDTNSGLANNAFDTIVRKYQGENEYTSFMESLTHMIGPPGLLE
jgi:hypothetical protein